MGDNVIRGLGRFMLAVVGLAGPFVSCSTNEVTGHDVVQLELLASYPEGLGYLTSVRELSDGRVLAADPLGQAVVVWDTDEGTVDTLGRVGSGPQEYRNPDGVFPLPADSTLLVDLGNARLTTIGPTGRFESTMPLTRPRGEGFPMTVMPRFVDGAGRIYVYLSGSTGRAQADSAFVAAYDRRHDTLDTCGVIRIPIREFERIGNDMVMTRGPLLPSDGWAVGLDGSLAIVRAEDYSIEWRKPDGSVVHGPLNTAIPVPVTEAEQQRYASEAAANMLRTTSVVSRDGSVVNMEYSRGGYRPNIERTEWPSSLPTFRSDQAKVATDGTLWVERFVSVGENPVFDVFDGEGHKTAEATVPIGCKLIGFGDGAAYLACVDEFDLIWLRKYRINR